MQQKLKPQASTQEHLPLEDVRDDLVILKDGGAALVLQTTAVNFGLLSEDEQDATIFAFAGLLNSLNFPIQIVVRSKKLDITAYLNLVDGQIQKQKNEDLKKQMQKYKDFISVIISENKVLDKRFYVAIPFLPTELGLKAIKGIFGTPKKLPYSKEYILERAKTALYPKKDHLIKQLARIGLRVQQLSTQQLIELFYDIYNPAQVGLAKLATKAGEYTSPTLVEPAVAVPPTPVGAGQTPTSVNPVAEPIPPIYPEPAEGPKTEIPPVVGPQVSVLPAETKLTPQDEKAVEDALKKLTEATKKIAQPKPT